MAYCGKCGCQIRSAYCPECGAKADANQTLNTEWEIQAKRLLARAGKVIDTVQKLAITEPSPKPAQRTNVTVDVPKPSASSGSTGAKSKPVLCTTLPETRAEQRWVVPFLVIVCIAAVLFTFMVPNLFMVLVDLCAIWGTVSFANATKNVQPQDLCADITASDETLLHAHVACIKGSGPLSDSFLLLRLTERRLLLGGVGRAESLLLDEISKISVFSSDGVRLETFGGRRIKLTVAARVRDSLADALKQQSTAVL